MFNPDITDLGAFEKAIDFALTKRLELEEALRQTRNVEIFAGYVAYAIPKFVYDIVQAAKKASPQTKGRWSVRIKS